MRPCSLKIHISNIDVATLGRSTATCRQEGGFGYDNRHVVPYNRYLLLKYQCHINVECCISIKSVKYIHKYIHKGHNHTTMQLAREGQPINEIKMYLDAHYVSAMEAFMRLS